MRSLCAAFSFLAGLALSLSISTTAVEAQDFLDIRDEEMALMLLEEFAKHSSSAEVMEGSFLCPEGLKPIIRDDGLQVGCIGPGELEGEIRLCIRLAGQTLCATIVERECKGGTCTLIVKGIPFVSGRVTCRVERHGPAQGQMTCRNDRGEVVFRATYTFFHNDGNEICVDAIAPVRGCYILTDNPDLLRRLIDGWPGIPRA